MESLIATNQSTAVMLLENKLSNLSLNDSLTMTFVPNIICEELIMNNSNNSNDDNDSTINSSSFVITNSALMVPKFFETYDPAFEKRRPPLFHQHSQKQQQSRQHSRTAIIQI